MEKDKYVKTQRILGWTQTKHRLCMERIDHNQSIKRKRIYQGSIYTCNIGENIGFEQGMPPNGNPRPALVISSDFHNATSESVIIAPLSTKFRLDNKKRPVIKAQYILYKKTYDFLRADSVVKIDKIREVDKIRLGNHIGDILQEDMNRIIKRLMKLVSHVPEPHDPEYD